MRAVANPFVPVPTPETQPYWDAIAEERLRITRCSDCTDAFFPPSPVCPNCTSQNVEWFDASGRATLYSYVIQQRPLPYWETEGPRSVAMIELEEGPRLISSVVGCEQTPDALQLDMALTATFVPFADTKLLCFEPAGSDA
ncbi:MAG: putative OB-fold protein [Candidatus Poriferisodalaceae bacterium]